MSDAPKMTADRRELWHLEGFLAVNGTTPTHHERQLRLYRYLCDTCEHEWRDVSGWGGCPEGTTQCSWCNAVLAPGERLAPASTEPLPTENTHRRVWQERYSTRVLPPAAPRDRAPQNYAEQRALLDDSLRDIPPGGPDA